MFWKIALGLGVFGIVLGIIFIIIAVRAFYASTNATTEDIAFGGLLISIILLVFAFLLAAVSLIFVLRNSKKEWDAKNAE
jgi:cytochrome c biogenesis factor